MIDTSRIETRLFIDNKFVNSVSGKTFKTINPASEEVICEVQEGDAADVDLAVAAAKEAFKVGSPWRSMDGSARRDLLFKLADLIERDRDYLTELESMNVGKPMGSLETGLYGSVMDVHFAIQTYRYYAGWADKIQGKVIPIDGNHLCYTRKEPVGVCAAIVPWNFPMVMQANKLAPALACGCTIVLKSSEKAPLSALHISTLVQEAGFPAGVVNTISGYGPTAGARLAMHPDIDKITFTGSTAVGHFIEKAAAESNLKRVSLELGGKSPVIVLDDADLEVALTATHFGLFLNSGQCCCAGSRIFVQSGIYEEFVKAAAERAQAIKVGPYNEPCATQGPQVDGIQFERVMRYIEKGKADGAKVACGGARHGNKGYFIQPTVFHDVTDDMTIAKEEIFGPVMQILKFETDEEAVKRANNTNYGLAAGVFSKDAGRALGIANQLRAGVVWVNTYMISGSAAPFGGYKQSGHGREGGEDGLENWLEVKCITMPLSGMKA